MCIRDSSEAADITYAVLSPEVHHILTAERGWTAGQYEQWLIRSLGALLRKETRNDHQQTQE